MSFDTRLFSSSVLLLLLAVPVGAQTHSTPIAERRFANQVARVNSDQDSITVIDTSTNTALDLDPSGPGISVKVGSDPRTLTFLRTGTKLYVANMRGEGGSFPNQVFGSVSVLAPASGYSVVKTITAGIGVEPFGVASSADTGFVAVTNFRSHSVSFIDTATDTVSFVFQYAADPNLPGVLQESLDADMDGQPDHANPRGIVVTAGGLAVYVTHFLSGHVTKLALTRAGASGPVTGATLVADIDLDTYVPPVNGQGQPVFVTADVSQGQPVNLESITIDPTGTRAWVPHTLLNFRTFVEPERYSVDNQGYPAVSIIDLQTDSFQFGQPGKADASDRIQYDPAVQNGQIRNVGLGIRGTGGIIPNLDVMAEPRSDGAVDLRLYDVRGGASGVLFVGLGVGALQAKGGTLYPSPIIASLPVTVSGLPGEAGAGALHLNASFPDSPALAGATVSLQAVFADPEAESGFAFTNAGVIEFSTWLAPLPDATFSRRVAVPVQVEFTNNGKFAVIVNHASEDIAIFDALPGSPSCSTIFPERNFVRIPFDASQPLGENPNGVAVLAATPSSNRLYVTNSTSHDVSVLRLDIDSGEFIPGWPRIPAVTDDSFTAAERTGREMFMDATRLQTTSNFNGTCTMCHFDGLQDGLTWHFGEGPRRTISLAGGPLNFGLLFFKSKSTVMSTFAGGFRQHHGGNGQFKPTDFAGFTTWTNERVPLPLNPRKIGGPTLSELRGRDLFFGENDAGFNPNARSAGCAECHPAGNFTFDTIFNPLDPCISLQENKANLRDVGTVDLDGVLSDDIDLFLTEESCVDGQGQPVSFFRKKTEFGTPTKLGAFAVAPYFHTGAGLNLRATLDPLTTGMPPQFVDTVHDLRGFLVSVTLLTPPTQQDIEDMLAFISSL
jgi:DNA-binding beta-propeller fold protein YncE